MKTLILILTACGTALMAENSSSAREYLDRAQKLEIKAKQHDENAASMATDPGYHLLRHKWPSMLQGKIIREKNLAMQARRGAQEAREMAAKVGKAESTTTE